MTEALRRTIVDGHSFNTDTKKTCPLRLAEVFQCLAFLSDCYLRITESRAVRVQLLKRQWRVSRFSKDTKEGS